MVADAQFEVLEAVVIADSVLVMDGFVRFKESAEFLLHDEAMLEDATMNSVRMVGSPCAEVAIP
jgi:hypothetical protein